MTLPSPEVALPRRQDIAVLPRWAAVALAVRCAQRVEPLFVETWPVAPGEHVHAVHHAIRLAIANARSTGTVKTYDARQNARKAAIAAGEAGVSAAQFAAYAAMSAADCCDESWGDQTHSVAASGMWMTVAAWAAARGELDVEKAAHTYLLGHGGHIDNFAVAVAASLQTRQVLSPLVRALSLDTRELKSRYRATSSEVPVDADSLGPLWPSDDRPYTSGSG